MKPKLWLFILLLAVAGALSVAAAPAPVDDGTRTGTLSIIAGDPRFRAASGAAPIERFFLTATDGATVELLIEPAARTLAMYRLSGQRVIVSGAATAAPAAEGQAAAFSVESIQPAEPLSAAVTPAVSGNTKWLTIACKFADVAEEPRPLAYFSQMYSAAYPGFDHYWREASYGNINLVGSTAVGWYTMPHPLSYYVIDDDTLKWDELLADCAALADPVVNFPDYKGINLAFNAEMGCCAWGGNQTTTLDGITREWSVTWLPPWAYEDITVIAHEMTHAYGILWHAYAGNNAYGDPWDVVSNCWYYCNGPLDDPVYGCLGQHTSVYHRDYLGWIPAERKVVVGAGETTVELALVTQPAAEGAMMAVVPINGSADHYYALEFRRLIGYDRKLPGNSIVIHEIGGPRHPVQLIDKVAEHSSSGSVWEADEEWVAPYGGIVFHFNGLAGDGLHSSVTIFSGLPSRTVTLTPTADTYIDHSNPSTKYGQSQVLKTRSFYDFDPDTKATFLRFDNTQLPQLISRARLRLAIVDDDPRLPLPMVQYATLLLRDSDLPWTESGATYDNVSLLWWLPEIWYPAVQNGWYEWDITTLIHLYGADSLMLANGFTRTFSSRESANPPQLIIDYLVPPDEPVTTTFRPTNDAYVMSSKKTGVFNKPKLLVRDTAADQNAYIKFNLSGLEGAVQSATLRLWVIDGGARRWSPLRHIAVL